MASIPPTKNITITVQVVLDFRNLNMVTVKLGYNDLYAIVIMLLKSYCQSPITGEVLSILVNSSVMGS